MKFRTIALLLGVVALCLSAIVGAAPQSPAVAHRQPIEPLPAVVSEALSPSINANWPQWRGPGGLGISEEKRLPNSWGADENLLWKVPIAGKGHSSPIVWEDRVFLTTAIEGAVAGPEHPIVHMRDGYYDTNPTHRERYIHPASVGADKHHTLKVIALDAADGSVLWERVAWAGTPFDDRHRRGSYASPTPVTDGSLLFAHFGTQGVYAYDFDGELVWDKQIPGIPTWGLGYGSSPVLYGDLLIIVADRDNGDESVIFALDKKTGEEVWSTPRMARTQWSTPLLIEGRARDEIVVSGFQQVTSYDPGSGEVLWTAPGLRGNVIATPVANNGTVFVSMGHPQKIMYAIRLGAAGDLTDGDSMLWEYNKGMAYVASNLLYGDQLYLLADNGVLTALDAKTGEMIYEGGRLPVPGRFYASPVAYDGKILLASQDGDMFVVKAGPLHEVLAVNSIAEVIWASPAIAAGKLFVRGSEHLFCFSDLTGAGESR